MSEQTKSVTERAEIALDAVSKIGDLNVKGVIVPWAVLIGDLLSQLRTERRATAAEIDALRAERDAARAWADKVMQHLMDTPLPPEALRNITVGSVLDTPLSRWVGDAQHGGGDGE